MLAQATHPHRLLENVLAISHLAFGVGTGTRSAGPARASTVGPVAGVSLIDCSAAIHRTRPMRVQAQPNSARARSEMAITAGLRSFLSTVMA